MKEEWEKDLEEWVGVFGPRVAYWTVTSQDYILLRGNPHYDLIDEGLVWEQLSGEGITFIPQEGEKGMETVRLPGHKIHGIGFPIPTFNIYQKGVITQGGESTNGMAHIIAYPIKRLPRKRLRWMIEVSLLVKREGQEMK